MHTTRLSLRWYPFINFKTLVSRHLSMTIGGLPDMVEVFAYYCQVHGVGKGGEGGEM